MAHLIQHFVANLIEVGGWPIRWAIKGGDRGADEGGGRKVWVGFAGALVALSLAAQPKAEVRGPSEIDSAEGKRLGQQRVEDLLSQQPTANSTNTGIIEIREADGKPRKVPVVFGIALQGSNTVSTYEAKVGGVVEKLAVVRAPGSTNTYQVVRDGSTYRLAGNDTMVAFAGSDFWVADLGLEFLQWPAQRLLKKEMRRGQFCEVLESTNPQPAKGAYSRVVSWIAVNRDGIAIVHADAFDESGKLLKQFDPSAVEKVNGQWQLQEMEIRNRQTGSRTRIEFQF